MASLSFKLCLLLAFLSSTLLPISAFPVQKSRKVLSQLRSINEDGPYYGLITSSRSAESAFTSTGSFVPHAEYPYMDFAGRRFHIGSVQDKNVIFVRCGIGMVNAAATTQVLLDIFQVYGIVHFGISGNTNSSLQIGDVVVAKEFVHTGLWDWLNPKGKSPSNDVATLEIADYNVPEGGSNKLGKLAFSPEEFYSESQDSAGNGGQKLWFPVNDYYLEIASGLKGTKLENCIDESSCLNKEPQIVTGLKGSSSNAFINNAAYRKFLYQTFDVSSADMESSAVVMTSLSNGNPRVVVMLGLSNLAGGEEGDNSVAVFRPLAATNVAKVVVKFFKELPFVLQHAKY